MARVILDEVLKRKQISKRAFARLLGIEEKNVWRLFGPAVDPKLSTLTRWAKVLGVRVRDLIRE